MNQHLTEQQLIDYQFKLASEPDMNAAQTHLDDCEECRQRLQGLVRKFATLDLLREDVGISEGLLSKTFESAVQARPGRAVWLSRTKCPSPSFISWGLGKRRGESNEVSADRDVAAENRKAGAGVIDARATPAPFRTSLRWIGVPALKNLNDMQNLLLLMN